MNYLEENYIVLNLKDLANRLSKINYINNCWLQDYVNRSNNTQDLVCLFGLCKFIKTKGKYKCKLVVHCKDAIIYNHDINRQEMSISKLENYNEILFSMNNKNNEVFEELCDMIFKYCVQETDKAAYKECLGPEIGEEITRFINN